MLAGPILAAVLALIAGHGAAAGAVIGAMTASQWLSVGTTVLGDVPDIVQALDALPKPRGQAEIAQQLRQALLTGVVSKSLQDWLAANAQVAIYIQDQSIRNQR